MELDTAGLITLVQSLLVDWGFKVLGALAVLALGWVVARALKGSVHRGLGRSPVDATLVPFFAGITYFGVLLFTILAALSVVGVPVTSFIAVVGAAGLAIALAFQGTLSNLAAGVMLLTFRPVSQGHYVEIGGTSGTVKEVGVFFTTLATPDNVRIIVPNSQIFGSTIKNYSANETRRIDLVVGVGYDDDLNLAIETIREVLAEEERLLDEPEPVVAVSEMADSSVNLVVRPWVNAPDYWATRWDLTKALKERIEAAGLSIPYPQRDVHLFRADAGPDQVA